MAKITGLTNISGKLDGLVFYMVNGKQYVRKPPAPRKKNTESSKNLKLRAAEFGYAAKAAKHLRTALADECQALGVKDLQQRLVAVMMKVKACHDAPAGCRTVAGGLATSEGREIWEAFTFQKNRYTGPALTGAVILGDEIHLNIQQNPLSPCTIIELQINLENGEYRRSDTPWLGTEPGEPTVIRKSFRSKKNNLHFIFVSANKSLRGILI